MSFKYDSLQRLRKRFVNGNLHAEWSYDTTRVSVLDFERTGSGFQREYDYDDLLRVTKVTTNVDGLEFTRKYAYDSYYGRLKGRKYPSGEVVALHYDAYGYSTGEANPLTPGKDFVYRKIQNRTARGQVSEETFGNGLKGLYQYFDSTGDTNRLQVMKDSTMVQNLVYAYEDSYGNVTRLENALFEVAEVFRYDNLQRLDDATRTRGSPGESITVDYDYDPLGNIVRKDDFAMNYTYGTQSRNNTANAGPHAVASVTKPDGTSITDFAYDENGNMVAGNGRNISYDPFNKPIRIIEETVLTNFSYGPNNALYKQLSSGRPGRTTYYIGGDYEYISTDGMVKEKTYVNGFLVIAKSKAGRAVRYIHKDRLGSTDTITDQDGNTIERHGYDVFGKPLSSIWEDNGGLLHSGEFAAESTMQGFTEHEHLDNHRLIHMGGRAYDPNLGRFLSVDPVIQNLSNSQAINPYSYILNNPLSGVDPTGYSFWYTGGCCSRFGSDFADAAGIPPEMRTMPTNGKQGQGTLMLMAGVPTAIEGSGVIIAGGDLGAIAARSGDSIYYSDGTGLRVFELKSVFEPSVDPGGGDGDNDDFEPTVKTLPSSGYAYIIDDPVGTTEEVSAVEGAAALKRNPNRIFPFSVESEGGGKIKEIREGISYNLSGSRLASEDARTILPFFGIITILLAEHFDQGHWVSVENVTPTGFTFRTQKSHFDGPNATITFTFYEYNGMTYLRRTANAPDADWLSSIFAPSQARQVWREQAWNLSRELGTNIWNPKILWYWK